MRYVFLIYANEAAMKELPEEEMHRCIDAALEYDEALKKSGHFIVSHGLEWAAQATVLRKGNGKVVATDGPFAETKEQLLGFYLIEAGNRKEAMDIASRLPMLTNGSTVEVRAVEQFEGEDF